MKLLVVRHGAAMDKDEFARTGESDDLRPLTDEGKDEMKSISKGLRAAVEELDLLATSPLVRARETADIIAEAYGIELPEVERSLMPGTSFDEFEKWCSGLGEKKVIAIVGHDPHLSSLVTWLLTGRSDPRIRLKKGGACLLTFESVPQREKGTLNWLLTPRQLRRMSK
ncbi:MAG TPA: phosphohistidine phosphatase SixA [Gemmatimonadaceae bacterium]|nr:phosphohistidine phosphatase SixA [Gemmatimonadaceae bacterium]